MCLNDWDFLPIHSRDQSTSEIRVNIRCVNYSMKERVSTNRIAHNSRRRKFLVCLIIYSIDTCVIHDTRYTENCSPICDKNLFLDCYIEFYFVANRNVRAARLIPQYSIILQNDCMPCDCNKRLMHDWSSIHETAINFRAVHLSINIVRYRKDQKARAEMCTHCWDNGVLLDVDIMLIQWQRARAYV